MRTHEIIATLLACIFLAACASPLPAVPAAATAAPVHSSSNGGFAIYLQDQPEQPLVSMEDVIDYTAQSHTIQLTPAAFERINRLRVPTQGMPFMVSAGGETIYRGALWPLYSSASFDGVVILVPLNSYSIAATPYTIRLTLGYPSETFFRGPDPRSDARVLQALEQAGKLK